MRDPYRELAPLCDLMAANVQRRLKGGPIRKVYLAVNSAAALSGRRRSTP